MNNDTIATLRKDILMSNPYYRQQELQRILDIQNYFTQKRHAVTNGCLPTILINTKDGNIEYIYPDYVNEALDYINQIEQIYLN